MCGTLGLLLRLRFSEDVVPCALLRFGCPSDSAAVCPGSFPKDSICQQKPDRMCIILLVTFPQFHICPNLGPRLGGGLPKRRGSGDFCPQVQGFEPPVPFTGNHCQYATNPQPAQESGTPVAHGTARTPTQLPPPPCWHAKSARIFQSGQSSCRPHELLQLLQDESYCCPLYAILAQQLVHYNQYLVRPHGDLGIFLGGGQQRNLYISGETTDTLGTPLPISLKWLECSHEEMWDLK